MLYVKSESDLLRFLNEHYVATVATVKKDNSPAATTVYYCVDDNSNFYFLTKDGTGKYKNINRNQKVALVITDADLLQTVQAEGAARIVDYSENDAYKKLISDLNYSLSKRGIGWEKLPMNHVYKGYYALIKITPEWIRWSDFNDWEHAVQFEKTYS
jgi:uncharacterized pyridoxamine 5'-phosphate oxidase family protein